MIGTYRECKTASPTHLDDCGTTLNQFSGFQLWHINDDCFCREMQLVIMKLITWMLLVGCHNHLIIVTGTIMIVINKHACLIWMYQYPLELTKVIWLQWRGTSIEWP